MPGCRGCGSDGADGSIKGNAEHEWFEGYCSECMERFNETLLGAKTKEREV